MRLAHLHLGSPSAVSPCLSDLLLRDNASIVEAFMEFAVFIGAIDIYFFKFSSLLEILVDLQETSLVMSSLGNKTGIFAEEMDVAQIIFG